MPAQASEQTASGKTVEVDNMPDIAAEQAALAASTKSATEQTEQQQVQKVETVDKPVDKSEDLSPAAKQAKEAAAKEEDDSGVDFMSFLAQKNKGDKVQQVAEKKVETASAKTATEVTQTQQVQATPQARDLTGIDAAHHDHFKRMSNEAFAAMKSIYQERESLKAELTKAKEGKLPDSYYEHPDAYVLTPEFAQKAQASDMAAKVFQHWRTQLQNVRGGADTYQTLSINAQGQLEASAPIKVDRGTDTQLAELHAWAHNQYMQAQADMNAYASVHKNNAANTKNWISQFESQAFNIFDKEPAYKAMVADTVKQVLPPALQHNPLAPMFAKAIITMRMQAEMLNKAGKPAQAQAQQQTTQARQPSAAEIAGGGVTQTGKVESGNDDTFDQFQRAKKGLL